MRTAAIQSHLVIVPAFFWLSAGCRREEYAKGSSRDRCGELSADRADDPFFYHRLSRLLGRRPDASSSRCTPGASARTNWLATVPADSAWILRSFFRRLGMFPGADIVDSRSYFFLSYARTLGLDAHDESGPDP